jgi:RES domain-containing protein
LCRAVRSEYLRGPSPQPLFHEGSKQGRRYTPRGGPAGLYLASDELIAVREIRRLQLDSQQRPLPLHKRPPSDPVEIVDVETRVGRVLDLTDGEIRRRLRVSRKAILADWEAPMLAYLDGLGPMPLTQRIGLAAHVTRVVGGILYPSARHKHGVCLVVYPDRLAGGDRIAAYDSSGVLAQVLEPGPP